MLREGDWDEGIGELLKAIKVDELIEPSQARRRVIFLTAVMSEGLRRRQSAAAKYEECEDSPQWLIELDDIEARKAPGKYPLPN